MDCQKPTSSRNYCQLWPIETEGMLHSIVRRWWQERKKERERGREREYLWGEEENKQQVRLYELYMWVSYKLKFMLTNTQIRVYMHVYVVYNKHTRRQNNIQNPMHPFKPPISPNSLAPCKKISHALLKIFHYRWLGPRGRWHQCMKRTMHLLGWHFPKH